MELLTTVFVSAGVVGGTLYLVNWLFDAVGRFREYLRVRKVKFVNVTVKVKLSADEVKKYDSLLDPDVAFFDSIASKKKIPWTYCEYDGNKTLTYYCE